MERACRRQVLDLEIYIRGYTLCTKNGQVRIYSKEGRGTVIQMWIPREDREDPD